MDYPGACVPDIRYGNSDHTDTGNSSASVGKVIDPIIHVRLSAPQPIEIGGVDVQVLAANASRAMLWIENQSQYVWRIAFGVDAVQGFGPVLAPGSRFILDRAVPVSTVHVIADDTVLLPSGAMFVGKGMMMEGEIV